MNIDDLKSLMDGFDPAALLPELDSLMGTLVSAAALAIMAAPVILLVLGIAYILVAPKEANYYFGYRCYYGMGSVEAWQYSQRIAGLIWTVLGLGLTIVMFITTRGFAGMDAREALSSALTCILWEAGLTAVSCLVINTLVAIHFTAAGELRRRR